MAISKVKLPNNTTEDIHDVRITGVDNTPTSGSTNVVTSGGIYTALTDKQDNLTFDSTPTAGSINPVTSGGVYDAIQAASGGTGVVDPQPTQESENPVSSGGVFTALAEKQDDLTRTSIVSTLLATDYIFIERNGDIFRILASAVISPSDSANGGIETENGEPLLTESNEELLFDL